MTNTSPTSANPLLDFFDGHEGRLLSKWRHYFDIYHRHFARFRGRRCTVVEIGVYHGGSLQMWREYFGADARLVGVDIEPRALALAETGVEIMIGDQEDPAFLQHLAQSSAPIDILIDDGGHRMNQQINTFRYLYRAIAPDGVYLCEDLHTSYWTDFGGGYRQRGTFIEYAKLLVDQLTAFHSEQPDRFNPDEFTATTDSMHFYDSVLVIEKKLREAPAQVRKGVPFFPDLEERPSHQHAAPGTDTE